MAGWNYKNAPDVQSVLNPVIFGFLFSMGFALGNFVIGKLPWPM